MDDDGENPEGHTEPTRPRRWEQRTAPLENRTLPAVPGVEPSDPDRQGERTPIPTSVFDVPPDRFEERGELGRGGMGRVVEALDRALGRNVAIKHSLAHSAIDLARFEREVRITARLQHPSVVPILDVGRDEQGQPFYIMRKINGEPLQTRVEMAETIRERLELVPALLGAVDAAAYAHAQGIVHRDIKPANILLGPFGETLLIDWGIARQLDELDEPAGPDDVELAEALTRVGSAYGTPGFMAPEQARGEPIDRSVDVYALGATLYYVLTGKVPIGGSATVAIAHAASGQGPDMTRVPPEVPVELTAIATKALAVARADRYADASELAADLRRFLAGQLVAAHRYTTTQRLFRWIRRHRVVAAVTVAAAVTIGIVVALSIRSIVAERDRVRAAQALAESRAELLLLDRARALVDVDPTSALALLRQLPADSAAWPQVRELVRAAVAGGVERGVAIHTKAIAVIAVGPDGRVATAALDGTIRVSDPEVRKSKLVSSIMTSELVWLDARTLVYVERTADVRHAGLVDVETGARRPLPGQIAEFVVHDGRVIVRAIDGAVTAYDSRGEATALESAGALAIAARDGRLAVVRADRVVIVEGATRREHPISVPTRVLVARLSPDGSRLALRIPGAIEEWSTTREQPPSRWPRTDYRKHDLEYVGATLYAWSNDGSGFVSLQGAQPSSIWSVAGEPASFARFEGGALLATREGELACVDELGTFTVPHRIVDIRALAVDPAAHRGLIGTGTGTLLILDLAAVRPHRISVPSTTSLVAINSERMVINEMAGVADLGWPTSSSGSGVLAAIELASLRRTPLGPVGQMPSVWAEPEVTVTSDDRTLRAWNVSGDEIFHADNVVTVVVGSDHGSRQIYYTTLDGDLVARSLEPNSPLRVLGHYPPHLANGQPVSSFFMVDPVEGGVIVRFHERDQFVWFEHDVPHTVVIPLAGWIAPPAVTQDGTWWVVEDFKRLWRIPRGGMPIAVPLDYEIRNVSIRDKQIWAVSEQSSLLAQLGPDGALVRTVALPGDKQQSWSDTNVVLQSPRGLVVVSPASNVRYMLPLPRNKGGIKLSQDGKVIAALTSTTQPDHVAIAWWLDPVPGDPRALPAYIASLTNAQLVLGSDVVTWDP